MTVTSKLNPEEIRQHIQMLETIEKIKTLPQKWQTEAEDEPEGSPSESVLLYCADELTAAFSIQKGNNKS